MLTWLRATAVRTPAGRVATVSVRAAPSRVGTVDCISRLRVPRRADGESCHGSQVSFPKRGATTRLPSRDDLGSRAGRDLNRARSACARLSGVDVRRVVGHATGCVRRAVRLPSSRAPLHGLDPLAPRAKRGRGRRRRGPQPPPVIGGLPGSASGRTRSVLPQQAQVNRAVVATLRPIQGVHQRIRRGGSGLVGAPRRARKLES